MNVSIVIPVYNEALELDACLQAISQQTVVPFEVIVVDNNSTDNTRQIAQRYDFVTLLTESKQGVVHARTTGFNAAKGEIIGRIDADTRIPADWNETVQTIFADSQLDAISGAADYCDVAAATLFNRVDLFFRYRLERQLKGAVYLWGANMAMRRSAWKKVAPDLCSRGDMHEDFDLAIHLQRANCKVAFDERLRAAVSTRRIDTTFIDFIRYALVSPKTYAQHGIRQRWHMYEPILVCVAAYLPTRVLHRGYDATQERFTVRQLLSEKTAAPRVDPTTNVA